MGGNYKRSYKLKIMKVIFKKRFGLLIILMFLIANNFILPAMVLAQEKDDPNERPNAAENIDVKLQVPLPFVKVDKDSKVSSLKDYIEGFYKLLIGAGALFAVVMIIIAGYQWMASGGSSGVAGDAKKRIWNATIGLVLALLSYIILNTISPKLVSLELPKIDPVPNLENIQDDYCQLNPTILATANSLDDPTKALALNDGSEINFNKKLEDAICGNEYLVANNIGKCMGNLCTGEDEGKVCVKNKCSNAIMYGTLDWTSSELFPNNYVDKLKIMAVCNNQDRMSNQYFLTGEVSTTDKKSYKISFEDILFSRAYQEKLAQQNPEVAEVAPLNYDNLASTRNILRDEIGKRFCVGQSEGGLKGLVLDAEVNDSKSTGWLLWFTIDDNFYLNKKCDVPISSVASGKRNYSWDGINWDQVSKDDLWQPNDFDTAVNCNIFVDDKTFVPQ